MPKPGFSSGRLRIRVRPSRLLFGDIAASATALYVSVWLYEISNVAALSAQGAAVSLTVVGGIPVGVAGVSVGAFSPFTKALQMLIAVGPLLLLARLLSRRRLPLAEAFVISSICVYVTSACWEMLSVFSSMPAFVHVGVFVIGTGALTALTLHKLGGPLHLWERSRPVPLA